MAINGKESKFTVVDYQLSLNRQKAFPLDKSSIWYSLEEAQDYAANEPNAYVGQVIAVVDGDGSARGYLIKDTVGTLQEIGAFTAADIVTDAEVNNVLTKALAGTALTAAEQKLLTKLITLQGLYSLAQKTKASQDTQDSRISTLEKAGYQTAQDVLDAIADAGHAHFEVVDTKPTAANAKDNVMYLVMNEKTGFYDIYIKVTKDGKTEVVLLDDTTVDLSEYVKGPTKATSGNVPAFADGTGKVLKDSGFALQATVPAAPTDDPEHQFLRGDSTWGKLTTDDLPTINCAPKNLLTVDQNRVLADTKINHENSSAAGQRLMFIADTDIGIMGSIKGQGTMLVSFQNGASHGIFIDEPGKAGKSILIGNSLYPRATSPTTDGIVIGYDSVASGGIAIGNMAGATNAIQLGIGTNTSPYSLQVYDYHVTTTNKTNGVGGDTWLTDVGQLGRLEIATGRPIVDVINTLHSRLHQHYDKQYATIFRKSGDDAWLVNWCKEDGWYVGGFGPDCGGHPPYTADADGNLNKTSWLLLVMNNFKTAQGEDGTNHRVQIAWDLVHGKSYLRRGWIFPEPEQGNPPNWIADGTTEGWTEINAPAVATETEVDDMLVAVLKYVPKK